MSLSSRLALNDYLALDYPFQVIADPDGGYVIEFPDLPGCLTQVDSVNEIGPMAEDARQGWIETAYDHDIAIPLPSYPEEYSGKFNLRLPRSLHRSLAEAAERQGVSLNQHVLTLLARGDALAPVEQRLNRLENQLGSIEARPRYRLTDEAGSPRPTRQRHLVAVPAESVVAV